MDKEYKKDPNLMQLGDENTEKDNNEFSIDDDSAISWQDLLSDEGDMSNIIEEEKQTSLESVDINSLADDNPEEKNAPKEEPNEAGDLDLDAYVQEHNNPEESVPQDTNDIEIENYTQDINPQEEPVDVNIPYAGNDDALLVDDDKEVEVNNADLSGIVDDELLNLLDDGEPVQEQPQEQPFDDITAPAEDPSTYFAKNEETAAAPEIQQENKAVLQAQTPNVEYNEVEIEGEQAPANSSKRPSPIIIISLVVIIFVVIVLGAFKLMSSKTPDTLDIEQNNMGQQETFNNDNLPANNTETPQENTQDEQANLDAASVDKAKNEMQKEEEEKKLTDKKVIFSIADSGRLNPFVPSSLYRDKGLIGLDSSLPYPPETIDDDSAKEARKLFDISVTGIMYDSSKPSAILKFDNKEYFVQVGDRIDTYTVHSITKDYVAIENQYNVWKAFVGEIFEIDSSIPPSQQVKTRNGKRQYYSSDEMAQKR